MYDTNKSFQNVSDFKHLGATIAKWNRVQDDIKINFRKFLLEFGSEYFIISCLSKNNIKT